MAEFSIGIPTFNGWRRVEMLLTNLKQRTPSDIDHVIFVCDDSGKPDHRFQTRQVCQRLGAQYIENPVNRGVAASWNALVLADPSSKYVILLNDDVLVDKDWLRPFAYALRNNPAVGSFSLNCLFITADDAYTIVTGPDAQVIPLNVRYENGKLIRNERFSSFPAPNDGQPGRVLAPAGCLFGFRREMYNMVGGFDEQYFAFYEESLPPQEFVLVRDVARGTRLVTLRQLYDDFNKGIWVPGMECLSAVIRREPEVAFLTVREQSVLKMEWTSTSTLCSVKKRALRKIANAQRIDAQWTPITRVIRHRRRNKILHVRQKNGSVYVTDNHSMVIPDGSKFKIVSPNKFTKEALPRAEYVPLEETRTKLDLGEYLRGWDQFRQDKKSIWYLRKNSNSVPSEKLPSPKIPRWIDLTSQQGKDFCWILGFFVAEGSISEAKTNYGGFTICLACNATRKRIQKTAALWESIIRMKVRISEHLPEKTGWSKMYKLFVSHKLLAKLLITICGKGALHKKVPDFIYDAPARCKQAFIDGFMEGDGLEVPACSDREEAVPTIYYMTSSRGLAAGLAILLSSFGKKFSLNYRAEYSHYLLRTINHFVGHRDTKVVEELPDDSEYVYDIEVPGNHVFCAGVGPVVVHNTDFGTSCAKRGYPTFTLSVPPNNYHIWSATFGSAPERNWTDVMNESRRKFCAKWGRILGVQFSDAPDIHNLLMDKIPPVQVRWLGLNGKEREALL